MNSRELCTAKLQVAVGAGALLILLPACNPNVPRLSAQQAAAVRDTVESILALAGIQAGAYPVEDIQAFLDGFGEQPPTCPTVEVTMGETSTTVVLNYGEGCAPVLFPDSQFSGSASGVVSEAMRTAGLTFDNLAVDGTEFDGAAVASFTRQDDRITLEMDLGLSITGVGNVTGTANVEIDLATGVITIRSGDLIVTDADGTMIEAAVDDVVVDPAGNESFVPESGAAVIVFESTGEGEPPPTVNVQFTANSPAGGTVQVNIGDGPQFTFAF
jgi:hypothetical protein